MGAGHDHARRVGRADLADHVRGLATAGVGVDGDGRPLAGQPVGGVAADADDRDARAEAEQRAGRRRRGVVGDQHRRGAGPPCQVRLDEEEAVAAPRQGDLAAAQRAVVARGAAEPDRAHPAGGAAGGGELQGPDRIERAAADGHLRRRQLAVERDLEGLGAHPVAGGLQLLGDVLARGAVAGRARGARAAVLVCRALERPQVGAHHVAVAARLRRAAAVVASRRHEGDDGDDGDEDDRNQPAGHMPRMPTPSCGRGSGRSSAGRRSPGSRPTTGRRRSPGAGAATVRRRGSPSGCRTSRAPRRRPR